MAIGLKASFESYSESWNLLVLIRSRFRLKFKTFKESEEINCATRVIEF